MKKKQHTKKKIANYFYKTCGWDGFTCYKVAERGFIDIW